VLHCALIIAGHSNKNAGGPFAPVEGQVSIRCRRVQPLSDSRWGPKGAPAFLLIRR